MTTVAIVQYSTSINTRILYLYSIELFNFLGRPSSSDATKYYNISKRIHKDVLEI